MGPRRTRRHCTLHLFSKNLSSELHMLFDLNECITMYQVAET
jgi:hypothetical protein